MDKGTHILGNSMDRETAVKLNVVEKVTDKQCFEELYYSEPFAAKLLLETFKEFLDDDYFERIERQLVLFKFLKNYYPLELRTEIIDFVSQCYLRDDYIRIINEWNLQASEFIKQSHLFKYDAQDFTLNKEQLNNKNKLVEEVEKPIIINLTDLLLEGLDSYGTE